MLDKLKYDSDQSRERRKRRRDYYSRCYCRRRRRLQGASVCMGNGRPEKKSGTNLVKTREREEGNRSKNKVHFCPRAA